MMLLMLYVFKISTSAYVERMLQGLEKAPISQQVQATVIIIHNLILKVITTCLLHKFSLEDIQW